MKRYFGFLTGLVFLGGVIAACSLTTAQTDADLAVVAAQLSACHVRGEAADAGQHISTYNACVKEAGLQ